MPGSLSTRIFPPTPAQSPVTLLSEEGHPLRPRLARALALHGHVTVATARSPEGKLIGLEPRALEALMSADPTLRVIAECDGAAGRPLKAHASHEPVLCATSSLVLVLVGLDALDAPLDERRVHRPELLARRLGVPLGIPLGAELLTQAICGPEGPLERVGAHGRRALVLGKPDRVSEARLCELVGELRRRPQAEGLPLFVSSWGLLQPVP